jgi:hypothetical protein
LPVCSSAFWDATTQQSTLTEAQASFLQNLRDERSQLQELVMPLSTRGEVEHLVLLLEQSHDAFLEEVCDTKCVLEAGTRAYTDYMPTLEHLISKHASRADAMSMGLPCGYEAGAAHTYGALQQVYIALSRSVHAVHCTLLGRRRIAGSMQQAAVRWSPERFKGNSTWTKYNLSSDGLRVLLSQDLPVLTTALEAALPPPVTAERNNAHGSRGSREEGAPHSFASTPLPSVPLSPSSSLQNSLSSSTQRQR